jgi:hypothetical protein
MMATEPAVIKLAQALAEFMGAGRDELPPVVASSRFVTVALASAKTGLTEKAIRKKIETGVWVERKEFARAPDGHIMINMEGVEAWVEKATASRSGK